MRVLCWNIEKINADTGFTDRAKLIGEVIKNKTSGNMEWACFILENKRQPEKVAQGLAKQLIGQPATGWAPMGGGVHTAENLIWLSQGVEVQATQWLAWRDRFDVTVENSIIDYANEEALRLKEFTKKDTRSMRKSTINTGIRRLKAVLNNIKRSAAFRNPMLCRCSPQDGGDPIASFLVVHAPGPQDTTEGLGAKDEAGTYARCYMESVLYAAKRDLDVDFVIGDCNLYGSLSNAYGFTDLLRDSINTTTTEKGELGSSRLDRIYTKYNVCTSNKGGVTPKGTTHPRRKLSDHRCIYINLQQRRLNEAKEYTNTLNFKDNGSLVKQANDWDELVLNLKSLDWTLEKKDSTCILEEDNENKNDDSNVQSNDYGKRRAGYFFDKKVPDDTGDIAVFPKKKLFK